MKILGIHFGHDASFCLYNNGRVDNYFLTERTTKVKYDHRIENILDLFFQLNTQIDYISISTFSSNLNLICLLSLHSFIRKYKQKYNRYPKVVFNSDHHTIHANTAFYNSKFEESIVVVVDGSGSIVNQNLVEVESIYKFNNNFQELLYKNVVNKVFSNDLPWDIKFDKKCIEYDHKNIFSIGILYEIASILTGNTGEDCGKAMGLSSYGNSNKNFEKIFIEKNTLNNIFFKNSPNEIKTFLKNPVHKITEDNYKLHADFCYEVQYQTQKAVGDLIEDFVTKTGTLNVCISGGYGMNIVANQYYIKRFPGIKFYFEPLCNDAGCSIGSSILTYVNLTGNNHIPQNNTFYHGFYYDISKYTGKYTKIDEIAKMLFENKSIAVYRGFAEAGRRSLGNRSIFFNPLNPEAKNLVNKIKKREWYRPFAASVLEEDANIYFDMEDIESSPYMTVCFSVRDEYTNIIPGVVHVDNTCRIQTVSKNDGYLYSLLIEFKKISGYGILLNTSFNLAGDPLVETPEDAFDTLERSCLDYLWFSDTEQLFE